MATLETFEKVFGIKEIYMKVSEKDDKGQYVVEGYIAKKIPSKKNPQWHGFVFQQDPDDRVYSVYLGGKYVAADFAETIDTIQPKNKVKFLVEDQPSEDKTYYNIKQAEIIIDKDDDMREDEPAETEKPTYTNGAELGMERCNAANNATILFAKLIEVQGNAEGLGKDDWEVFADYIYEWHKAKRYE